MRPLFDSMRVRVVLVALLAFIGAGASVAAPLAAVPSSWVLGSETYKETFTNQPFVGNGYLGLRIPAAGEGYWVGTNPPDDSSSWPLRTPRYTSALIAGYYGRAAYLSALPTWSSLTIGDDSGRYDPLTLSAAQLSNYHQATDMQHGVVTTSVVWTSPGGNKARLTWTIFAHQKYARLGVVRMDVTPLDWRGPMNVDAFLDLRGVRRAAVQSNRSSSNVATNSAEVEIASDILHTKAVEAFTVSAPSGLRPATVLDDDDQRGLSWSFTPVVGTTYTFIKYVGVAAASDRPGPAADVGETARQVAKAAADGSYEGGRDPAAVYARLLDAHEQAWLDLWQSDVIVDADHPHLQSVIHASEYALYANVRQGARASIAPAGLTSDNYAGMIFWDAETWMYPFLLAMHPELAKSIVDYRYDALPNALRNVKERPSEVRATRGGFFPWTSGNGLLAVDRGETPEIHLQADIALAQYQYYEATGDKDWLRSYGWPVMKAIADYYCSRATKNPDGSYSIRDVDGPDEYTVGATDAAYTNGSAILAIHLAIHVAQLLGLEAPAAWRERSGEIVPPIFDPERRIHLQFAGYSPSSSKQLKQADVVLLSYPMEYPMPSDVAINDLNFYAARTDPLGPAMTNSVQAIIAAQFGLPSFVTFFNRAYEPYVMGPYLNFNETSIMSPSAGQGYPAYTFVTGAGGFLQALSNGIAGFRFREDGIALAPVLPRDPVEGAALSRVYLKGMHWQGRTFDVDVTPQQTDVTLTSGPQATVRTPSGQETLAQGRTLIVNTRVIPSAPGG
ncbi:glycoside hydrolase family 65 protein [Dyella solisilvae]|uniref:Glycoside hydrolase family 65 protein n=1 Tax=Dyella solisilvae TaxID=1920168 RepID=A0A370K2E6_9GAMM|nr:glycosyl hydrolase family 65 protein [Dyella solisilvae]RDI96812.1 glycoside hydrolase family 65 protein [Dyella solisilvae]